MCNLKNETDMKRAFRIMGLCALVAIAATSCKKEAQTTSSFKATLTQPTSEAKTHLGSDSYLYWNEGDAIKVFDADGNDYLFTTTDNDTTATFTGTDPIDVNGDYTAFYPAANAEKQGNEIRLTLPATQDYAEGTFGNATYPMAAVYAGNDGFTFSSPCGLLAIPVSGSGNISTIELTSRTASEVLAGQLRYNLSGAYQGLTGTQTTVTLNCGNLTLSSTATTFYFVLPAGVFANGFTAVLKNGTTELYTLEAKQAGVNTIEAQKIKLMPEVEVQAIAVTTSAATGISKTTATLNGSYEVPTTAQGMNVTEVGFYFGTDANPTTATPATLANPFSLAKTGLTAGTTYYYKAYAKNGTREYEGPVLSFTTLANPTVSTGAADVTTARTATGHVTLTNAGSGTVTELGLCWGTSANPTVSNNHAVAAGQEVGTDYAINITGLTPSTPQYYVRGYAKVGDEYYYAANSATFSTVWNGNLGMLSNDDPVGYATATEGMTIYNTLNENVNVKVSIADGASVTLSNANITGENAKAYSWAGLTCLGDATIVLADGTTNTVKGFYEDYPGIHIAANKTLTIQGSGSLTASSNGFGAGIGGGYAIACGNIVINGGTINAIGGDGKINSHIQGAAGIGSGFNASCGFISINNENGTVEATGGAGGGAGIGSGYKGICGNITIDGTVTATGGYDAAGIGSGFNQYRSNVCGMITINGGTITATGGYRAAGIGTGNVAAGEAPTCSGIIITGGEIEARGGDGGAGIGVGSLQSGYADCGSISISGGLVTAIGGGYAAGIGSGCVHRDATSISTCGDISITGGTVIATGGAANDTYQGGAGIGTGSAISSGGYTGYSNCGNITIANTVTSVTATKGSGAQNSIGKNHSDNPGTCGTVKIGGTVTGNISISPYTYHP